MIPGSAGVEEVDMDEYNIVKKSKLLYHDACVYMCMCVCTHTCTRHTHVCACHTHTHVHTCVYRAPILCKP